jgi:exonuclease SbcC|tara:strand:- start:149 stop:3247 length:3099 start_codon:yes stop_codon:yes gene_type:complete
VKPLKLVIQAFGPFATREIIDFSQLGRNPLFLINGVTGSGKSSILDAICFALYGQTTDTAREGSSMRCDYAADNLLTELIFDFSLGDYRYRIRRTPKQEQKKKRGEGTVTKQPEAQLWRVPISSGQEGVFEGEASELLVPKKSTEANAHIITITGLSVDQFRQVMVLPQGKFRELLLAESSEREAIFSQLFQTHIYKSIEDKLKEQSAQIRREREQLKNKELGLLASAEFTQRSELALELEQLLPRIDGQRLAVDTATAHYVQCLAALDGAEKVQQRLAERERLQQNQKLLQVQDVGAWRKKLQRHEQAETLKSIHVQRQQANDRCQQSKCLLLQEQQTLAVLEVELARVSEVSQQAKKNAGSVPNLQRQQQELQRLQHQVEKLQLAQVRVRESEKNKCTAEQNFAALQVSIESDQAAIVALESQILAWRIQLQELSGISAQLEQLKNAGLSLKDLQRLKLARQTNAAEQHSLQFSLNKKHAEFETQRTAMLKCELSWHQGQAAVLAQTLDLGAPCPVCGSCEHPFPASDLNHSGVGAVSTVDKEQVDAERNKTELIGDELKLLEQKIYGLQQQAPVIEGHIKSLMVELGPQAELSIEELRLLYIQCNERYQSLLIIQATLESQETALLSLRQALERQTQNVERACQNLHIKRQQLAVDSEVLQGLKLEVNERYRIAGVLSTELGELAVNIESLQREQTQADLNHKAAIQNHTVCTATIASVQKTIAQQCRTLDEISTAWAEALSGSEFTDDADYLQALLNDPSKRDIEIRVQQYQQQSDQLQGRLTQLEQDLEGRVSVAIEPLQLGLSEANTIKQQFETTLAQSEGRNQQLRELEQKLEASRCESERLDQRYAVLGTLSDIAGGQNSKKISLQRFVLSVLLDDVLVQASQRLQLMSQGRYQLIRKEERAKGNKASGLELEVEDAYTGKARPVATLSGGESFMAALSMALGLSDVVQAYSGGIKLDTLFIDEGFGSLDQESLELALRTLIDLQASGRTIGIISHVTELKEQMAQRIDVESSRLGSKVSVINA